jgi:hypothetical protein
LAGWLQAKNGTEVSEPARATLRAQARGWLKEGLAIWSKVLDGGGDKRGRIRKVLEYWKFDTDVADNREEAELAKLPEEERPTCRALWNEVCAVQQIAQTKHAE